MEHCVPETSAYKIQTPGSYPEENIQHTEHGKSLKSRTQNVPSYLAFAGEVRGFVIEEGFLAM